MFDSNNSKLIDQQDILQEYESLSAFLRDKSERLQEKIGKDFKKFYPQQKIADSLRISKDQLQQKIYRKKPLTRDWLIAICAAYGLNDADTSEALSICDMPTLDDTSNRELFIVDFLREHEYKPTGIDEFNYALEKAGLMPLEISFRNNTKIASKIIGKEYPYKEVGPKVIRTYENPGDPYNCLTTVYLPNNRCVASALLEDEAGKRYLLEAHSDGDFLIREEGKLLPTIQRELDEENIFYCIMSELSCLVKKRKRELDLVVKDSKNFKGRYSANIKYDALHIFYEEYNYTMPERNEYYLMEYINGEYILSIAHESMFMQEYLSEQKYIEYYGKMENINKVAFSSVEDINKYYERRQNSFYPDLQRVRISAYKRLKGIVEEKLALIKSRDLYIQDFGGFDIPSQVISYYEVEKEFECTYDNEYGEINFSLDEAYVKDAEDIDILLSFSDLKDAFELGVETVEDICRLKKKYGEIKKILES